MTSGPPRSGSIRHRRSIYCFGCQASGDLFTFVQETEGVDFKGALELLAERNGVELQREEEDPREGRAAPGAESGCSSCSNRTTAYYERYLWESEEGGACTGVPERQGAGRGGPERVPRRLRPERVGPCPETRRVVAGSQSRSYTRPAWRNALRRTGGPMTASDRGSCSR